MTKTKSLSADQFDYEKLADDLKKWCKENNKTFERISQDNLYKNPVYLSCAFSRKAIPGNVALALVKLIGAEMRDYKIKVEKKAPAAKKEDEKIAVAEGGWSCFLKVDEEIGVAMVKILKNGEEIAVGRSYTYGNSDQGILQGISYAAHMCYKMVQQEAIAHAEEPKEDEEEEAVSARVCFRDWIKKYEKDSSRAGSFARYVKNNYGKIPATGKKKIRSYLRLNGGASFLVTFDTMWDQYFRWCEANAVGCGTLSCQ